jgi:pyruvate/2-oxoglutarate dehydrogenase complex dihydrolipoamide acyltransferase (E2) component
VIFDLKLPLISPHMTEALIECLYAAPGSTLKTGDKLLDLSVDLSGNFAQDCPPISYFRIIIREAIVLRELRVARGESCPVGHVIALFGSTADGATDQPPQRGIRIATAGIIHHGGMWTGNDH